MRAVYFKICVILIQVMELVQQIIELKAALSVKIFIQEMTAVLEYIQDRKIDQTNVMGIGIMQQLTAQMEDRRILIKIFLISKTVSIEKGIFLLPGFIFQKIFAVLQSLEKSGIDRIYSIGKKYLLHMHCEAFPSEVSAWQYDDSCVLPMFQPCRTA